MINVRSFADMNRAVASSLSKLDRNEFDVIVGIPRSGMLPATLLATFMQLPLADLESFAQGRIWARSGYLHNVKTKVRVLLVDDSSNRGGAMERAVARIKHLAGSITRYAVYGPYREDLSIIDIFAEECRGPRAFQWNMWKHKRMPRWGFDFDGVLCRDPTKAENDDGPNYLKFLRTVEPLHRPQGERPLGPIITGRLEKYRAECQDWLGRQGIAHGGLHMMPYASKAERMAAGGRGQWKAEKVKELGLEMFVESCPKQARIIAREARVPVWCTATCEVFNAPVE